MIKTRLTELVGLKYPIIQAGMGPYPVTSLCIAAANAGCLGLCSTFATTSREINPIVFEDFCNQAHAETTDDDVTIFKKMFTRVFEETKESDGIFGANVMVSAEVKANAMKVMQAIKRDTPLTYEYTGFVEAKDQVSIKSKVTGTIIKKYVNGGDYVEAGQLLYEIDPRAYEANVLNAQANLANAQASLANAQRDAARYQSLYEEGAVSKQTADQYNTALEQAQASVNAYQALVTSSQVNVSDTKNRSLPFAKGKSIRIHWLKGNL